MPLKDICNPNAEVPTGKPGYKIEVSGLAIPEISRGD